MGLSGSAIRRGREKKSTTLRREQKDQQAIARSALLDDITTVPSVTPVTAEKLPPRSDSRTVDYTEQFLDDDGEEWCVLEEVDREDAFEKSTFLAANCSTYRRTAIDYYFEGVLDSPGKEEWPSLGTVSDICVAFKNDTQAFKNTVKLVIETVMQCQDNNVQYTGEGNYEAVGRKPIIKSNSIEAEIIADAIESGNSIEMAAYTVNQHREAHDEPSLTYCRVLMLQEIATPSKNCPEGKTRLYRQKSSLVQSSSEMGGTIIA